jgi:hypothetical protein
MDNLVSIYHGGTVERDRYEYVEFIDMQCVPVLFNEKPSFSELTARARDSSPKSVHSEDIITRKKIGQNIGMVRTA